MMAFLLTSVFLGIGLAMDAFSVSMVNGLYDPQIDHTGVARIAGCFAGFQFLMPMVGYICVHTVVELLPAFTYIVPFISLILLGLIGIKMIIEGSKDINNKEKNPTDKPSHGLMTLLIQGIATSIDALSVGFTLATYSYKNAFICSMIIAVVTYIICVAGVHIGKRIGILLGSYASIFGGIILICIGLKIVI